ncbi:MAG: hypothetical protein WA777_12020, partial [Rhodanobacter sp.]
RATLMRTIQHRRQYDDLQQPERMGKRHHASGVDRKSLTELLGAALAVKFEKKKKTNNPRKGNEGSAQPDTWRTYAN